MTQPRTRPLRLTAALISALLAPTVLATELVEADVGLGVARTRSYIGSDRSVTRVRIWGDIRWRTERNGTVGFDSGSLLIAPSLQWNPVDTDAAGWGVLLGYREGRDDRDRTVLSDKLGDRRLSGLPEVSATVDAGVQAHATLARVPLFVIARAALSKEQGTTVMFGSYLPVVSARGVEITVVPAVTWADARQRRALYGVEPGVGSCSCFAAYDPGAGWDNVGLEVVGAWRVTDGWHLVASTAFQRLLGDSARSPIVFSRSQFSAFVGIERRF